MPGKRIPETPHFTVEALAQGVYACIHKPGGAAFSNAGIIDLGGRTLVVDAHEFLAAGRALRRTAETLFNRPVDTLVLTHSHNDHWIGTAAFDPHTAILATEQVRGIVVQEIPEVLAEIHKPGFWEDQIAAVKSQIETEKNARIQACLQNQLARCRYGLAERDELKLRGVDRTFAGSLKITGSQRSVEIRAMGWGHSNGDAVVLLPGEKIAFLGDISFFAAQPYMAACRLNGYREQVRFFLNADYTLLVPGHGPIGGKKDLELQMEYFDVMERLVGGVVTKGGSIEEALQIVLPEKFQPWLLGGMRRFENNVRFLYKHMIKKRI